mmetsp:Transcript_13510/g.14964  ORF Transcript_13510/g.14964 Transcript_13510/m.14964 type:complete len:94 (+) Transcript_13510:86-367(+)
MKQIQDMEVGEKKTTNNKNTFLYDLPSFLYLFVRVCLLSSIARWLSNDRTSSIKVGDTRRLLTLLSKTTPSCNTMINLISSAYKEKFDEHPAD